MNRVIPFVLLSTGFLLLSAPDTGAHVPPSQQEEKPRLLTLPSQRALEERATVMEIIQTMEPQRRLELGEAFLQEYPDSPFMARVLLTMAEAYRMQGNFEKTIEVGKKVLEQKPGDLLARILLADALVEGTLPSQTDAPARYQRAEKLAHEALNIIPTAYPDAARPPGVEQEQYDRQRRYVEAQPHASLGFLYLRRGDFLRAEDELKKAVELNQLRPNGTDHLRLAFAHIRQAEWAEAKVVLDRCVELGGATAVLAQEQLEIIRKKLNSQTPLEKPHPE